MLVWPVQLRSYQWRFEANVAKTAFRPGERNCNGFGAPVSMLTRASAKRFLGERSFCCNLEWAKPTFPGVVGGNR